MAPLLRGFASLQSGLRLGHSCRRLPSAPSYTSTPIVEWPLVCPVQVGRAEVCWVRGGCLSRERL
jgi:hypothetical protein